jgi:hypothetical protein
VLLIRRRQHRVQGVETLLSVKELVRPLGRLSHGLLILITVDDLGGHLVGPAQEQRTHRIAGKQRIKQPSHPLDIPHLIPLHKRELPPIAPHSDAQQLADRVRTRLVELQRRGGGHGSRAWHFWPDTVACTLASQGVRLRPAQAGGLERDRDRAGSARRRLESETVASTKNEEPVLARFPLTPTTPLDEQQTAGVTSG